MTFLYNRFQIGHLAIGGEKDNLRYLTLKNCDLMSWNTENKCNKLQQPETDVY